MREYPTILVVFLGLSDAWHTEVTVQKRRLVNAQTSSGNSDDGGSRGRAERPQCIRHLLGRLLMLATLLRGNIFAAYLHLAGIVRWSCTHRQDLHVFFLEHGGFCLRCRIPEEVHLSLGDCSMAIVHVSLLADVLVLM